MGTQSSPREMLIYQNYLAVGSDFLARETEGGREISKSKVFYV